MGFVKVIQDKQKHSWATATQMYCSHMTFVMKHGRHCLSHAFRGPFYLKFGYVDNDLWKRLKKSFPYIFCKVSSKL